MPGDLLPADLLPGGIVPWLVVAGVVALYLAYRAVRLGARLVSLTTAAALFLGAGPLTTASPVDLPWSDGDATPAPSDTAPRDVPIPSGAFTGVVTRVSDGDSLRVRITDPGTTPATPGSEIEARLLRIDAPELARDGQPAACLADESTAALGRLAGPGTEVHGAYDIERRDRYDRELVHLWTSDGRWVNGAMLAAGLARVVTFAPNTGYEHDVRAAEDVARTASRGIWDPAVCPG